MRLMLLHARERLSLRGYDAVQHMHSEWRLLILVIVFATGSIVQIIPKTEPLSLNVLTGMSIGLLLLGALARKLHHIAVQAAVALTLGMACAAFRIDRLDGAILGGEQFYVVEGTVKTVETRPNGAVRLIILPTRLNGKTDALPRGIRLLARTEVRASVIPGSHVKTQAILHGPRGAITPGGFDFARKAYFDGIGGEGFAAGPVETVEGPVPEGQGFRAKLEILRQEIAERIMAAHPDQSGAVAVALLVGYRHYLMPETVDNFRDSGLAHLMAISGLHMGLISAAAFFLFELVFAAIPAVALRMPPRKLAAIVAWSVALGYLMLSGMGVATVRAFVMVSIGLLAVLMDRRVLSIRNVAIAAGIILAIWPEAVLSVGFQMSFAATSALVVAYERLAKAPVKMPMGQGLASKTGRFLLMTGFTTIVAEVAVAPFALFHFQATPLVGLGANLVAVPVVSLFVMPLALLALLLMPFGLEAPVLHLMAWGLDLVREVAAFFGAPSFGVAHIPQQSGGFLVAGSVMLVAVLLLKGRLFWGPALVGGLVAALLYESARDDILIDSGGSIVAVYDRKLGRFDISGGRRGGFRDDSWARYWGLSPEEAPGRLRRSCDSDGCITKLSSGLIIANARSFGGMRRDCARADIVIMPVRWRRYCRGDAIKLSEEGLARYGPVAYEPETGALRWSREKGNRPWHAGPMKAD